MKNKIVIISLFLALLGVSYFVGRHISNQEKKTAISNIIALRDSVRHYVVEIDKLKYMVAEKNAVVLSQKDAIKSGMVEKEALKKLNIKYLTELNTITAEFKITRDSLKHNGIIGIDPQTSKPYIGLPFTFSEINRNYSVTGGFNNKGAMNLSVSVPLKLSIYGAVDKKGVAKVSVLTDNPMVKISEITSVKIEVAKPKRYGFGIMGGYGIAIINGQAKLAPTVTAGIYFRIW